MKKIVLVFSFVFLTTLSFNGQISPLGEANCAEQAIAEANQACANLPTPCSDSDLWWLTDIAYQWCIAAQQ